MHYAYIVNDMKTKLKSLIAIICMTIKHQHKINLLSDVCKNDKYVKQKKECVCVSDQHGSAVVSGGGVSGGAGVSLHRQCFSAVAVVRFYSYNHILISNIHHRSHYSNY